MACVKPICSVRAVMMQNCTVKEFQRSGNQQGLFFTHITCPASRSSAMDHGACASMHSLQPPNETACAVLQILHVGLLPPSYGNLSSQVSLALLLSGNSLSGSIPAEWGQRNLSMWQDLSLSNNREMCGAVSGWFYTRFGTDGPAGPTARLSGKHVLSLVIRHLLPTS
jgi:hypothetical protein